MTDRKIFVISDTHFEHANIIKYCNRPFKDTIEMNETLINNWNEVVRDHDIVYHLGDVYMGRQDKANWLLSRLKGRKRLVLGNHDIGKDKVLHMHFEKIMVWRMFPEYGVLLTHVPVHDSALGPRAGDKFLLNVHGHIHDNDAPSKRHRNVSVERIDYRPINIEEIR